MFKNSKYDWFIFFWDIPKRNKGHIKWHEGVTKTFWLLLDRIYPNLKGTLLSHNRPVVPLQRSHLVKIRCVPPAEIMIEPKYLKLSNIFIIILLYLPECGHQNHHIFEFIDFSCIFICILHRWIKMLVIQIWLVR